MTGSPALSYIVSVSYPVNISVGQCFSYKVVPGSEQNTADVGTAGKSTAGLLAPTSRHCDLSAGAGSLLSGTF